MTNSQHFLWLTQQWGETFLYPPFAIITLILLIGVVASRLRQSLSTRWSIRDRSWLAFGMLLIPWLMLLLGTVWRVDSSVGDRSFAWPVLLLMALWLMCAFAYGFLSYALPGSRWFLFWLFLLTTWLSWWASFLATMSISGDWV